MRSRCLEQIRQFHLSSLYLGVSFWCPTFCSSSLPPRIAGWGHNNWFWADGGWPSTWRPSIHTSCTQCWCWTGGSKISLLCFVTLSVFLLVWHWILVCFWPPFLYKVKREAYFGLICWYSFFPAECDVGCLCIQNFSEIDPFIPNYVDSKLWDSIYIESQPTTNTFIIGIYWASKDL